MTIVNNEIKNKEKILILGASGTLGHSLLALMSERGLEVYGTLRSFNSLSLPFYNRYCDILYTFNDIYEHIEIIESISPTVIVNAIGVIKHSKNCGIREFIAINSIFPRIIAGLFCPYARIIHFSTDCVFDGKRGNYTENDIPNATDIYGITKMKGELSLPNCITIRTSLIGHELRTKKNLLDWFLSQPDNSTVKGYSKAIFSGLCVTEIEKMLREIIIPTKTLNGIYHVSSDPIDKYSLLTLIRDIYKKEITIEKDEKVIIDRSLDSSLFRKITNYKPPSWRSMVEDLYNYYVNHINYYDR